MKSSLFLALFLLGGAAYSAYRTVHQLRLDREQVVQTREMIDTAQDVFNQLRFAEGGRRGYLLTHKTKYLRTYQQGVENTRSRLAKLHQLVQREPDLGVQVDRLDPLVETRFSTIAYSIAIFQKFPDSIRLQVALTDQGMQEQQAVWDKIDRFNQIEVRRLQSQRQQTDETIFRLEILEAVGGGSSVLLLACAYYVLQKQITQRQKVEAEARKINLELVRSNQELEAFAFIASHDLQEPLRVIENYANQLIEENLADQFALKRIAERTTQMRSFIRDLLTYARVGTDTPPRTLIDCNLVLKTVLENLQVLIAQTQAQVTSDSLPTVQGNWVEWIELLQNLIENAIQYRAAIAPKIHISAQFTSSWLFSVQDNGIGIPAAQLDRIFDLFQRTGKTSTGIGLAICRKIIDRQGGKIWAESELGQGTTIYFKVS